MTDLKQNDYEGSGSAVARMFWRGVRNGDTGKDTGVQLSGKT